MSVVATTGMVADTVRAIAGERGEVFGLIGAGVDPHLFRPTRSDIERLLAAELVFYNGLLLEGKLTDALVRAATAGTPTFAVTEQISEDVLLAPEAFEGLFDPHVWMDPRSWRETIGVVRDQLSAYDPAGAESFASNAEMFAAELDRLDAYAERVLAGVPEERRVLVTAHDAFNYFGRRYGFEVLGIQGISTESEAGVRDIQRLVEVLVEREVPAVFVESTVPDKQVRALIDGARARGHDVVIGGELYSDAMGAPGTYEGTYIGMLDHNVTTIARALGADAPEGGMDGRLGGGLEGP
ncbi:MAG: zinc ABC transporter substrate-binding protein [Planctomycetota bacterium]